MSDHAYFPPSGADAWVHCSLWPRMNRLYPQEGDEATREGDAAHWLLLQPGTPLRAPNGVAITREMEEGRLMWRQSIDGRTGWAEQRIDGHTIDPANNWGTPDWYTYDGKTLEVLDYKFGHGLIEVFENWQLINYLALLMDRLGIGGFDDQRIAGRVTIVQPRGHHRDGKVRTWNITRLSDVRAHINLLHRATEREPAPAVGPHCKYCPGRHACDGLQRNALADIDLAGSSEPMELTPTALGHELRAVRRGVERMQARMTGLEEQARAMLGRGQRVPFVKFQESRPRERWSVPIDQVIATGNALGVSLEKKEALTPAQARTAGLHASVVAALAEVPRGELQLVEDDGADLRKLFGK